MSHSLASAHPAGFNGKGRLRSTCYFRYYKVADSTCYFRYYKVAHLDNRVI